MPFNFLRGQGSERLDRVEDKVQAMFALDREEFELAMSALLGDSTAGDVNDELRGKDQTVNRLEREIRRELVIHSSVYGGIETPAILVYMSIVKDIERIGDYAKNLMDLARDGANFSRLPDAADWRRLTGEVAEHIVEVGTVFRAGDPVRAREVLAIGGEMLTRFDGRVSALVRGDDQGPQPVARALANRYMKRIVAHMMNVLSAVVMPVDQLDYFDEDAQDRR